MGGQGTMGLLLQDGLKSLALFIYGLLLLPFGLLAGPFQLDQVLRHPLTLWRLGILPRALRGVIHWRLGLLAEALKDLEVVARTLESCEQNLKETPRQILADVYRLLVRAYLFSGHMDHAMEVILRAGKSLGVQSLEGLPDLDLKTAQLVRAGLAAGKIVLSGGSATMVVQGPTRQGASAKPEQKNIRQGKVIPFPERRT